jgi:hypothetical protein
MTSARAANMISKLICVVVAICAPAFAQESHTTFRGAYIGEPVTDYVNCDGKPKAINEGYKTRGKSCDAPRFVVYHMKVEGHWQPKEAGESFQFNKGKLSKILILIPNNDWDKVRFDLTQKLGEPSSEVPQIFQNGFGARWEYNQGFWRKGDLVAVAGIKVVELGGVAMRGFMSNSPATEGIQITIESAQSAGTPDTSANSLD